MQQDERKRLRIIAGVILFLGMLFIVRLYMLQVVHHDDFIKEAQSQYISTLPNLYNRGNIYFTQKDGRHVAAASVGSGYVIAIVPKLVTDEKKYYDIISALTPLDKTEFMAKVAKKADPYEEIATRVPEDVATELKALKLPGVQIFRQTWRFYPAGSLAAQTIGFVGYNGKQLTGRYGLESYYNDTLTRNSENLYVNFFAELFSNITDTLFDRTEDQSGDLVLTIEPTVQSYLETEIQSVMDEWHSDETGAIIMDPKTGAIYAMAVNPSFDLNQYGKVKDVGTFGNPSVEDVYEMGSIVKPITMAAGLDAGVISESTTYNDTGHVTLNNKTFSNYDGRGRGPNTPMQKVLNDSLNTGVAFVVGKLGNQRFADYILNKFHVGEETGIDLPGERQGLVSNLHSKRDIEYATASFGQGIAVTPINMIAALAILGNGGLTVTPHLVSEIDYTSGKVKQISQIPPEQAITPQTSERITRMLVTVVDKALLNGSVSIPEYSVAAKTGTAQIARSPKDGGGYYEDRYLHTFFGYFPAYNPKFIVFMYTYNPKNATFASHTLTLPFMRITKFLLNYYDIPPDRGGAKPTLPAMRATQVQG
jgi:cell division protein FtsI/penicillin-binding protein 2